jgi:Spy/CpxP family protein refolding chaperone
MIGRARAALVIGAIVLGSALVGAAIDRGIVMRQQPRRFRGGGAMTPPTAEQDTHRRQNALDRMSKDLELSNAQRVAIDSIMQHTDSSLRVIRGEMQPRLKQVFESSRTQIEARLDAEQRAKFAKSMSRLPRGREREDHPPTP